ncbi:hypothetical protein HZB04_03985 [Candidatus Wolfebacteria bacterium]|nr:hypothetical protein [Candidatus Wolfebacteria bacterium]
METIIKKTINLPQKSVENLFKAMSIFESAQNEIEDFLISSNKFIMNKVKKAHKEHSRGELKDFSALVKKYV